MIYNIILITIIIFALFVGISNNYRIKEGYAMLAGTEGPIAKSDFYTILNECITNIQNHDVILNTINPKFTKLDVSIDPNKDDFTNIQMILVVMKVQDLKIQTLLPTYIPNTDLDGLITGKLLQPIAKDLFNKSTIPENPLDCNVEAIQKLIDGYQALADSIKGDDDQSKNTRLTYLAMITPLRTKIVDVSVGQNSPGNVKCLPPLSTKDSEGILDGFYSNYMIKIITSQDNAIKAIQSKMTNNILNFYSSAMNT